MKVFYDISWLGYSESRSSGPTGLDRVTEALARQLADSGECELTLCAGDSFGAVGGAITYLERHPKLGKLPFSYPKIDYGYHDRIDRALRAIDRRKSQNYLSRAIRSALRDGARFAARYRGALRLNNLEPAVYHSPYPPLPEASRGRKNLKRFLTIHDLIPIFFPELCAEGAPELLDRILKSVSRDDFVFVGSQATKDDLCNHLTWLEPERVKVTYWGIDERFQAVRDLEFITRVKTKYGIPEGRYLLTLGSLEPRKGMEHAIETFRDLAAEPALSDVSLVIAGPRGWKDSRIFEAARSNSKLAARIVLTGRIEDDDLPALYSGATVFIFPSLYEGFGLPPLEAMQCATPVIAANATAIPEVVGNAGLLIAPRDRAAWREAILRLLNDECARQDLAKKGLARAGKFSWKRCRDETLAAYRAGIAELPLAES